MTVLARRLALPPYIHMKSHTVVLGILVGAILSLFILNAYISYQEFSLGGLYSAPLEDVESSSSGEEGDPCKIGPEDIGSGTCAGSKTGTGTLDKHGNCMDVEYDISCGSPSGCNKCDDDCEEVSNPSLTECGNFCCGEGQECASRFRVRFCRDICEAPKERCGNQACCLSGECKTSGFPAVGYCFAGCGPGETPHPADDPVVCCGSNQEPTEVRGYPACSSNSCDEGQNLCGGSGDYGQVNICCGSGCATHPGGAPRCA